MTVTSDDDVPELAAGQGVDPEGDPTATLLVPRTTSFAVALDYESEEEERTLKQQLDPTVRKAANDALRASAAHVIPSVASPSASVKTPKITSKKPTAVGLGSPVPVSRLSSHVGPTGRVPVEPPSSLESSSSPVPSDKRGTLTRSGRARPERSGPKLPLSAPLAVQIRDVLPSGQDEAQAPTLASPAWALESVPATTLMSPSERPPEGPSEADEGDDSITAQAPSMAERVAFIESESPRPSPHGTPSAAPAGDTADTSRLRLDVYEGDESVTTPGPVVLGRTDDSVTEQAPLICVAQHAPAALELPPTFDLGAGGRNAAKRTATAPLSGTPRTGEHERVADDPVAEPLQNPPAHDGDDPDGDDAPTEIAPFRAARRGARPMHGVVSARPAVAGALALDELRMTSSDSGLRLARADEPSGANAAGVSGIVVSSPEAHYEGSQGSSSIAAASTSSGPVLHGWAREAAHGSVASVRQPMLEPASASSSVHEHAPGPADTTKPRYGLLVTLVALLSVAIPVGLFFWLQRAAPPVPPRSASELAPDRLERSDPPREKATRPVPADVPSASASSSAHATKSKGGRR